jgi:hypothetical protein
MLIKFNIKLKLQIFLLNMIKKKRKKCQKDKERLTGKELTRIWYLKEELRKI